MKKMTRGLAIVVIALISFALATAQGEVTGFTTSNLNMRAEPNSNAAVITQLPVNTTVIVEGRNEESSWLLVRTVDGSARGWMSINFLGFDPPIRIPDLPIRTDLAAPPPAEGEGGEAAPVPEPTSAIPFERTDYPALWINNAIIRNARAIYARGIQQGNNPNALTKIGESNTAGTVYMCPFHYGNYDLGEYGALQGVVERFSVTGSWCHYNHTAQNGFTTASVLDSLWASSPECQAGETPLDCELRLYQPSYALIYIGIADMAFYTPAQFRQNLTDLVTALSRRGVVPILTTFPMDDRFSDGNPQRFNAMIRDVATRQTLPLIDLRSATYEYANRGTGADGYHLSVRDNEFTSFGGDQNEFGRTLRELLTLQMLQQLAF